MKRKAFIHRYRKALASHHEVGLFGEGLKRHGWTVQAGDTDDYKGADLVVQWNTRMDGLLRHARRQGAETCILETSYIEPRKDYVSVSFGEHINGRNRFYGPFHDPSRWQQYFDGRMSDWGAPADGYALIMGQMPGDQAVRPYVNFYDWAAGVHNELAAAGHQVQFRAHPGQKLPMKSRILKHAKVCVHAEELELHRGLLALQDAKVVMRAEVKLREALQGAKFVVTFNSNSGVDAALFGRPVIAVDKGSMAWDVAGHKLGEIVMPNRAAWAYALAWKQWTRDELASGDCWEYVCPEGLR